MERKEHPVATISGGGKVLKLLDPDGNPYTPPVPVDYQILDEDGEVLKQGTVKDTDEIPLDDVSATSFRVMIDSHLVLNTKGFESPMQDEGQKTIDGPTFDPDDDTFDEFQKTTENQKDEGGDDDSGAGDDSGSDDQDEKSGSDDDSSSDDDGSKDSDDESSASDGDEEKGSDSDDSKDSDDQGRDTKDADDSKGSDDDDSGDSDKKSADDDDQ